MTRGYGKLKQGQPKRSRQSSVEVLPPVETMPHENGGTESLPRGDRDEICDRVPCTSRENGGTLGASSELSSILGGKSTVLPLWDQHIRHELDFASVITAARKFAGNAIAEPISRSEMVLIRTSIINGWNPKSEVLQQKVRGILTACGSHNPRVAMAALSTLRLAIKHGAIPADSSDTLPANGDK